MRTNPVIFLDFSGTYLHFISFAPLRLCVEEVDFLFARL